MKKTNKHKQIMDDQLPFSMLEQPQQTLLVHQMEMLLLPIQEIRKKIKETKKQT